MQHGRDEAADERRGRVGVQQRAEGGQFEGGWMARKRWGAGAGQRRAAEVGAWQGGMQLALQACARAQRACGPAGPAGES
jgi:hypothetical protein